MSILKSLAKETAIYGMSYALVRVLNFILLTPFLAYLFKSDKAFLTIHADIYFYIALAIAVLGWRMETAYFRYVADSNHKQNILSQASQLIWISCLIFLLIVTIFRNEVNGILRFPNMQYHIIIAGWIIVLDVICALPYAKLRYDGFAKKYAIIKLISVIINLILVFVFLLWLPRQQYFGGLNKDPHTIMLFVLLANLIGSFVAFILLFPQWKNVFARINFKGFGTVLRYIIPLIIVTIAYTINQFGSTSFLKYFLPGTAQENLTNSADFNAAFRLSVIMSIFVTAFNYAAEPFFFRHAQSKNAKRDYAQVSVYFTIVCCIILLTTCLFSDVAMMMFPKNYHGSMHLLAILLLSNYFVGLASNFSTWYKLTDRTWASAVISLIALLITFVLSVGCIPRYGVDASAWILLFSNIFITIASYIQGQKHYQINYPILRMITYIVICILVIYYVPNFLSHLGILQAMKYLIYLGLITLFAYCAIMLEARKTKEN